MRVASSSNFKSTWELVETPKDLANYKVAQPSGPLPTVRGFDALPDPASKRALQESQSSALTGMLGKRVILCLCHSQAIFLCTDTCWSDPTIHLFL